MNFIAFQNRLALYPIFSLQDARKLSADFHYRQMDRWAKKGYIKKLRRGFYCFTNQIFDQNMLFHAANKMYAPSYISFESALKYYGLIPEEIFQVSSVSTRKTAKFETPQGNLSYRQLKPNLFWGYRLIPFGRRKILLAEPEKALLDYLYIHPKLRTADDFEEMRLNRVEWHSQINPNKFEKYLELFESKALKKRAIILLNQMLHDQS